MVTYLGSLAQLYCGKGGTLETNITGMCGECLQCMDHTGFATAQGSVCFLGLHCSGSRVLCKGTVLSGPCGFLHFPGLSHSGSLVLCKGTDPIGCIFCALPRSKQLRQPGVRQVHCPRWAVRLNHLPISSRSLSFPGAPQEHHLRCAAVCLLWGADLRLRPSWPMSAIQDPRKMWLATGNLLSLVEDAGLWGRECSIPLPSGSGYCTCDSLPLVWERGLYTAG